MVQGQHQENDSRNLHYPIISGDIDFNPSTKSVAVSSMGGFFDMATATFNTGASLAVQAGTVFHAPTFTATTAGQNVNYATTVYIDGPPIEGTNANLYNKSALMVSGNLSLYATGSPGKIWNQFSHSYAYFGTEVIMAGPEQWSGVRSHLTATGIPAYMLTVFSDLLPTSDTPVVVIRDHPKVQANAPLILGLSALDDNTDLNTPNPGWPTGSSGTLWQVELRTDALLFAPSDVTAEDQTAFTTDGGGLVFKGTNASANKELTVQMGGVVVAEAVPTGTTSTPFWAQRAAVTTPVDPVLPANFLTFKWDSADDKVYVYVNDAGTIRNAVIGTVV